MEPPSDVGFPQHLGHPCVQLLAASHRFEAIQQILGPHARPLRPAQVMQDLPTVHHDDAVAEMDRLLHRMGDHQSGQFVALDDFMGEPNDLVSALGIKRCRMLVQQQEVGLEPGSHEQRERLALSAGEAADGVVDAVLQAHVEGSDAVANLLAQIRIECPAETAGLAASGGHGQVLRDRHGGSRTTEGVLENATDEARPTMLWKSSDVLVRQRDATGIDQEGAGHGIEQGRFSAAVGADDDQERSTFQRQRHSAQSPHLIRSARIERLDEILEFEHGVRWRKVWLRDGVFAAGQA